MSRSKLFALIQLFAGSVATLLVALGYFWFNNPLQTALTELDSMAGRAETEIATVENLLTDIDGVAESIQNAIPSYRDSLDAVGESTMAVSETINEWEAQIPGVQDVATDAAHICDTFAAQLPIRVPAVNLETKLIKFQLPEVIPKTQDVDIPYPTATVTTSTKKLSYPSGAEVETKGFSKSLGSFQGKNFGSVSFDYPSGISITNDSVALEYPSGIKIGTGNKSVTVPATPEIKLKDYSFDVPDKLEVTHRELMKDEKVLLEKSSKQLTSMTETLGTTRDSLTKVRALLESDVQNSLDATSQNLAAAETALTKFRTERIPGVLTDLKEQRHSLNKSRGVFVAISGLIPLGFCVLALVTVAIALSGAHKFFATPQVA